MKEQLIEKLEYAIMNYQYGTEDRGLCCVIDIKTIIEIIQALTSVKSESAKDVLIPFPTGQDGEFRDGAEIKTWMNGYEKAMHDFANNSEAMRENAIKFAKYITNNKNNEWDKLYNIYLTNKEK